MSTKGYILIIVSGLTVFTLIINLLIPEKNDDSRTPLVWATDANPQREPQVAEFNKLNPDLSLSIDPANRDVMKVMVQCSANMGADIIGQINESNFQLYHAAGILEDITAEAKDLGFSPETLPEQIRSLVMMQVLNKNGELEYRQFVYVCNVWHGYIFYNKNVFDKYGVPYPPEDLTWDEYFKIVKKLTIREKGKVSPLIFGGMDGIPWANPILYVLMWEMGGGVINSSGTRAMLGDKNTVKALIFYHNMLHKWKVEPTPAATSGVTGVGVGGAPGLFGRDSLAMMWASRYMVIPLRRMQRARIEERKKWLSAHPGAKDSEGPQLLRMGACLVPRFKNGPRYTTFGARCAGINKKGKNKKEVLKFLKYLTSEEYCKTINQGGDSKPGPTRYIKEEYFKNKDFPGEQEVNRLSIRSIKDSRLQNRSTFIANSIISRILLKLKDKIVASKNMTPDQIRKAAKDAAKEIDLKILRNIQRNKSLRKIYDKLQETGAEPIRYEGKLKK